MTFLQPLGGRREGCPRLTAFRLLQASAAVVVLSRLSRGRRRRAPLRRSTRPLTGTVSVVVPARDEERRLAACLSPLAADSDLLELLVVDDESSDATAAVARAHGAQVIEGRPLPPGWAGKAWALEQGLSAARGDSVLFLDADTRPRHGLARALLEAADGLDLLSAGPRFLCDSPGERLLHPTLLATLVYRFGPTDAEDFQPSPSRATANGQCLLVDRRRLRAAGGWARVRGHLTEDVAMARALRHDGARIGFVDATALLDVRMYASARETWSGWGRSLAMADATRAGHQALDLACVWLCQAAPLLRVALRRAGPLDWVLLGVRLALHTALAGSYHPRGASFWLAPLIDVAAAARLTGSALRPSRSWRGRSYPASGRRAPRSGS